MNQIKAGAILNYIIIALNTIIGLAYTPLMLRCLGQNEYGIYSLVSSVIAYLTILDFGFGNAIVRYTAKFRAEGKKQEQWEMFGMFLIVYIVIGLIALCGGICLYLNVDTLFDRTMSAADISQAKVMMALLALNLAFTFPLSIFGSIITAYENFVFQRVVSIIRLILMYSLMVALLLVGYKAIALVIVNTIFNFAVLAINYYYCIHKLHIKIIFQRFNWGFIKEISIYSFWIFLNSIMDRIYWGTGQFVLGTICGTTAVAIFSVGILLETMYMQFSGSISGLLLPKITAMVSQNKSSKEISDIFIRTGRIQNIILLFILSGFIVFGKQFILLWAGENYSQSYIITLIFFIALYIPLIQNTGIIILQARNQMRFRSLLYVSISLFSLIMQIILASHYGAIGCAYAIGGALLLGQGLIINIYYHKIQKIDITRFWTEISKMLIMPLILTILGIITTTYMDIFNVKYLVISILIYSIIYIYLMWKYSINTYERNLIRKPIKKILTHY